MKLEGKVDIGVDIVYIVKELADEISLPYKKEKAMWKELMWRDFQSMELLEG